ncbi:MAG: DNA primase [Parcubacteria group bacterium Athens1014_10]|nr:MAG: DNA primase [Parcubacteria group bacterium Athens1014_10]TSD05172.1 MAG: DNA primase [Parcubacteria group bacterium Athens0714_12]
MIDNAIEEIKSRLDITEIISEYITLRQAGINFRALCPFHKEKTPSFFVSPERQLWKCFGCNEGGDIFAFVMKMEGIEFPEALRLLAKKAGVELETRDPRATSQKTKLLDICQETAAFYQSILYSQAGEKIKQYLKERKISEQSIKSFFLGYAPDSWNSLLQFLTKKGHKEKDLESAGLIIKKAQGGYYDRFRNRLMFTILDPHSVIVGFAGRSLDDQDSAKYINSPETRIYYKSRLLYAVDKAKSEIKKMNFAILVEGYMDVISSHQAGIKNVVASAGTSLTMDQIKLLKRYTANVVLAFDIDLAGQEATKRSIDLLLEEEVNVKIAVLSRGKDPDELIKKSPQEWKESIEKAKRIMDYYFDSTFSNLDIGKVEDKKKAAKILLPIIAKIGDKIEQSHWLQKLSGNIKVEEKILREVLEKQRQKIRPGFLKKKDAGEQKKVVIDRYFLIGEQLIGLILKSLCLSPKKDESLFEIVNNLPLEALKNEKLQELAKQLIFCYNNFYKKNFDFSYSEFKKEIGPASAGYSDLLLFNIEKDFPMLEKKVLEKEINQSTKNLKKNLFLKRLKEVENQLKNAENKKNKEEIENLTQELKNITQELFKLMR